MTAQQEYVFDPTWNLETERLITNEAIWDPGTIERFERLGVAPGWSCLEVGAGHGGAAEWLAERTGRTGRVVVADLEVDRLTRLRDKGVEVTRHDLRSEEFPAAAFDLVHSRMVVQHLPDKAAAIGRLIRAVKPGGLLFLEDTDSLPLFRSSTSERFLADIKAAGYGIMRRAGHDPRGGHFDLQIVLDSELTDVSAEGRVVVVHGGSPQARHYQLWLDFMRSKIVEEDLLDDARLDEAIAEMGDPAHRWLSQVLISTYGRKPLP
jgi:SAM-dependent methyltransferase